MQDLGQDFAGFNGIWQYWAGFGRILQDAVGFGRILQDLAGFVVGFGSIWQDSAGFNRIGQDFAGFLYDFVRCGRIWQDLKNLVEPTAKPGFCKIWQDCVGRILQDLVQDFAGFNGIWQCWAGFGGFSRIW